MGEEDIAVMVSSLVYEHGPGLMCSTFDRQGADLGFVQDWLGHANTQKTIIQTVLNAGAGCAQGVHTAAELLI